MRQFGAQLNDFVVSPGNESSFRLGERAARYLAANEKKQAGDVRVSIAQPRLHLNPDSKSDRAVISARSGPASSPVSSPSGGFARLATRKNNNVFSHSRLNSQKATGSVSRDLSEDDRDEFDAANDASLTLLGSKAKSRQQHRLDLLRECAGVSMVNYDWLAMADYPDNLTVVRAKKHRDCWILANCALFTFILVGISGYLPAWIIGSCVGMMIASLAFGVRAVRSLLFSAPTYGMLMEERKKLEFRALTHIKLLEGKDGMIWKCRKLADYNPAIAKNLFAGIMHHSRQGKLLKQLKSKSHIRLYLLFTMEAEKAYRRLKSEYFKKHRINQLAGLDDLL
ncbi:MAG: hypothetical protein CSA50_07575 [Gammaproteobacteria bacterium]|nr:MAG: hypothetical protein CSA50_07575 [Gammaproteobacteria bacterium]